MYSDSVVSQTQPPIVFGAVSLQDLSDKTFNRITSVNADGSFQFPYLPPGKYELKTKGLSDQPPFTPGQPEHGPGHTFADVMITVQVMDKDLDGVTIKIPDTANLSTR